VPPRLSRGLQMMKRHAGLLARIENQFGVSGAVIVAIWGLETDFGAGNGRFQTVRALATLAYDCRRPEKFRPELFDALRIVARGDMSSAEMRGAWAGEIGQTQFMPSSYLKFAVDYDGDGRRDLNSSPVDAIGSVANFLKAHGWGAGRPIAAPAQVSGESFRKLIDAGIKPLYRIADLPAYGVAVGTAHVAGIAEVLPPETGCALIELETPGQPSEYWVGLQNFYALTRYNRSSFYAIAVLELAREIVQAAR
jgi:lytic murein transglycosylase B